MVILAVMPSVDLAMNLSSRDPRKASPNPTSLKTLSMSSLLASSKGETKAGTIIIVPYIHFTSGRAIDESASTEKHLPLSMSTARFIFRSILRTTLSSSSIILRDGAGSAPKADATSFTKDLQAE